MSIIVYYIIKYSKRYNIELTIFLFNINYIEINIKKLSLTKFKLYNIFLQLRH